MPKVERATSGPRKALLGRAPGWLSESAPDSDVCLSTRSRLMRNLAGYRFPHAATSSELRSVSESASELLSSWKGWEILDAIAPGERAELISSRLISPDFRVDLPHRLLGLCEDRVSSVMVNEEDHLRFQVMVPGWSLSTAETRANEWVRKAGESLKFAYSPRFGFLSASPFNCGDGIRRSALLHLVGLAHQKRLRPMIKALSMQGVVARGLFGESSRAIGAWVQLSMTAGEPALLQGAGDYLIQEERAAREEIGRNKLDQIAKEARDFAISSRSLSLAEALRVQAWVRWASSAGLPGFPTPIGLIDRWLFGMVHSPTMDEAMASRRRAEMVRESLEAFRERV